MIVHPWCNKVQQLCSKLAVKNVANSWQSCSELVAKSVANLWKNCSKLVAKKCSKLVAKLQKTHNKVVVNDSKVVANLQLYFTKCGATSWHCCSKVASTVQHHLLRSGYKVAASLQQSALINCWKYWTSNFWTTCEELALMLCLIDIWPVYTSGIPLDPKILLERAHNHLYMHGFSGNRVHATWSSAFLHHHAKLVGDADQVTSSPLNWATHLRSHYSIHMLFGDSWSLSILILLRSWPHHIMVF
jgi:hypothetical protein